MKLRPIKLAALSIVAVFSIATYTTAAPQPDDPKTTGGIQWYSTLDSGKAAAKETGRPILFLSAAPHCGGVSGAW